MSYFGLGGSGTESWRDHIYGQRPAIWILVISVILVLFYLISRIPVEQPVLPAIPQEEAWTQCMEHISMTYGYSPAEAEPYLQSKVSVLPDDAYLVKINYGDSIDFRCTVQQTSDDQWHLVDLEK